jgi:hypothetical protein
LLNARELAEYVATQAKRGAYLRPRETVSISQKSASKVGGARIGEHLQS